MKKTIENKIRLNVVLIYVVALLLCTGMSLFFYYNHHVTEEEKENIEERNREMTQIKDLINRVNTAQKEVSLYISTKRVAHLRAFRLNADEIKSLIDTLKIYKTDSFSINILHQLELLLKQKELTVSELRTQFRSMDISDDVKGELKVFESDSAGHDADSFGIRRFVTLDTIVKEEPKKNFWEKLSGIFSAEKPRRDTLITSFTEITDTVKIASGNIISPQPDINELVGKIKKDYEHRISSIEKQVSRLIMVDLDISSRISAILIDLYNNMIDARLNEIEENESRMQRENTVISTGGVIALFLILIFIILIINNANKGLRMRVSLEESQLRTRQLTESRHKLLLSVSHDIKTPVSSILGYMDVNRNLNSFERMSMRNSGKYILSLLDNLLEFSALEQENPTVNASVFNLSETCSEINEMFLPLACRKNLTFDYVPDFKQDLHVTSDLLKVKQIIINLLSNAIKYTVTGGIEFYVHFEQEKIHVRISDSGVGIPQSKTGEIFKPFSRIDEHKNIAEGSGIGLYVVKGLTDLLGGHISVDSSPGKGTVVSIKIPAPATDAAKPASAGNTEEKKPFVARRIWIIDDDPVFLDVLKNMLVRLGNTVISSNTAADFEMHKKYASSVDTVLTDMEVGTLSGTDILHKIKENYPDLPVFVMTGRSDFNQAKAQKSGFDGYLPKPVTVNMLSEITAFPVQKADRLASLREMFDNDEDAVRQIHTSFCLSTMKNLKELKQLIKADNFAKAQALCHKMMPMFMHMGLEREAGYLKKMDRLRDKTANSYPEWKTNGLTFINDTKTAINNHGNQSVAIPY
jgi:signal transduction histidine kinase/CheY-like chemotaxis protein/predicted XRE-type DNA-binding protein